MKAVAVVMTVILVIIVISTVILIKRIVVAIAVIKVERCAVNIFSNRNRR